MDDPLPRPASGLTIPPKSVRPGPKLASSPTIAALARAVEAGDLAALERFWRDLEEHGTPLVEPAPAAPGDRLVTFVVRGGDPSHDVVLLANRVTEPDAYEDSVLRPLPGSDLRYLTLQIRADWRASYALGSVPTELPDGAKALVERSLAAGSTVPRADLERWFGAQASARPDPLHKRDLAWQGLVGDQSWVELPDAPPARVGSRPGVPAGHVREVRFESALLGNARPVWVYTPAAARSEWLLVLTDGEDWVQRGLLGAVLDAPIATGALPPMTAVLVDSIDVPTRIGELACSPSFVDALDQELLPSLPEVGGAFGPRRTIIAGASLGGLTAAYACLRAPHRFGNAYSQSGSFWWPTTRDLGEEPAWLNRCFAAAERTDARFRLEVGLQERGLLHHTRHLRDVLVAKGYPVSYEEFNGGHDRLCWAASLASGLEALTRPPRP